MTAARRTPAMIDPPSPCTCVPAGGGEPVRLTEPGYVAASRGRRTGRRSGTPRSISAAGHRRKRSSSRRTEASLDRCWTEPRCCRRRSGLPRATSSPSRRLAASPWRAGTGPTSACWCRPTGSSSSARSSWSPSGRWLLYSMSTGREPTLCVVPRDGSAPPARISPDGAGGQQADWQPVLVPLR